MEPQVCLSALIWAEIRNAAEALSRREPLLRGLVNESVFSREDLGAALAAIVADELSTDMLSRSDLEKVFTAAVASAPDIPDHTAADIRAVLRRDPAVSSVLTPFLYLKGVHALFVYRLAHALCGAGRVDLARYLQSRSANVYGVDINPHARIGCGIMLDHATGIVIGETCVIADNVSILQGVTLGGTGKDCGDRHPKVASGVMIGAGARVLGNIHLGEGCKIGAGSVVLTDVPPHTTVVGVPARVVGRPQELMPALGMDQHLGPEEACPVRRVPEFKTI